VGSAFRDLVAYRQARAIASVMHDQIARWPNFDRWSVGIQLIRALDSVAANIAESTGRWHRADERRLLLVARGSLYESEHWLLCAEDRGLLPIGSSDGLEETARALNGLIRRRERS
jgi:four helix bundle protein